MAEADESPPETAISLQEVATRLNLSYQTVFARRRQIGFRLEGSRVWRVWPSTLATMGRPQYNSTRLTLRSDTGKICQSDNVAIPGGSISARQAASELDALLKQRTVGRRRSTTTA